ncbi:MAG TPA: tetratricopeptide repeat protein [Candidatus Limnocylindria bacterium]|nr:tetratricopeptide repeat protein [Candidatus Limnocylindria bacterium]
MMQAIESWQSKQLGAKPETNTNGSIELAALMQKLRKSASEGDAKAQWELAKMYHAGSGVAKDPAEEFHWCLESAKQGLAVAQCSLAVFYQFGQGTTNNNDLALEWYRKASGQSFAPAQCNLGMLYDQGLGVTMDHA